MPQEELAVIANTINNVNVLGLEIYPDLEYLIFLLAGKLDIRYWETLQGDTYSFMDALSNFVEKEDLWFRFGDILFSHIIVRKHLMNTGKSFSEAIEIIAQKLGITAKVLPMTDDKVVFKVSTDQGDLPFLEYRNKELEGLIKEVKKIEYDGIKKAKANSNIYDYLSKSDAIVIGPSNPPLNVEPMLAFQDIKNAIEKAHCSVIAISPVLGDEPIDQPMRRLMEEAIGIGTSINDIVERYPGLIDTLIIDENDEKYKEQLEDLGMEVIVTKVRIGTQENRTKLAEIVAKLI